MTVRCYGSELARVKRRPDSFESSALFSDDIHDHFSGDRSDLTSLLRAASDQELLDIRSQAQRLREEKLAQHEELLRRQLESNNNNNNNNSRGVYIYIYKRSQFVIS